MASILCLGLTFEVFSVDLLHIDFHWFSPIVMHFHDFTLPAFCHSLTFQLWIHFIFLLTLPDSPNDQDPLMDCQWWWGRTWLWPDRWKPSRAHQLPHRPGARSCIYLAADFKGRLSKWWKLTLYSLMRTILLLNTLSLRILTFDQTFLKIFSPQAHW